MTAWILAGIAATCVVLAGATAIPARSHLTLRSDRPMWGCASVTLLIIAVWFAIAAVTR